MGRRRTRYLLVDRERYAWSLSHLHDRLPDGGATGCREILSIRPDGSATWLEIVFAAKTDHLVPVHAGGVQRCGADVVNLNQPGQVRALLDAALAQGWQPTAGRTRIDGWTLLD